MTHFQKLLFCSWGKISNILTLFDSLKSSDKPFWINGPKYNWVRVLCLSGWKSFKDKFLVTVLFWLDVLQVLFIYWGHCNCHIGQRSM